MISWLVTGVNPQSVVHRYFTGLLPALIWNFRRLFTDVPWLDTGIESLNCSCRCALARYKYRIHNQITHIYALARYRNRIWKLSSTDMPWLDAGIESGNCRLHICPGWMQVSNLEIVVYRYALAGYRYRISKLFMQMCPG